MKAMRKPSAMTWISGSDLSCTYQASRDRRAVDGGPDWSISAASFGPAAAEPLTHVMFDVTWCDSGRMDWMGVIRNGGAWTTPGTSGRIATILNDQKLSPS